MSGDEIVIQSAWEALEDSCVKICRSSEDWDLIRRAYLFAKEAHRGVRRRSGEPYLLHPIAVARIVVDEIGLGVNSVTASLLHDVVEDTDYTLEDIESMFGEKVAQMVDGLTKISGAFREGVSEQAEYFRKMLLTLSDDLRVILIKIADRLHNMRTLGVMPHDKQVKITSETIYLFAPLAYRLGLYAIKSELEDLSMKYRYPAEYEMIERKLAASDASRQEYIEAFSRPIRDLLDRYGISYDIRGRVKSVYSVWSKMQRKGVSFEQIYDLFAIRIIFKATDFPSEGTQCWQIYGAITDIYKPNTERLRDWVSLPKENGYEALHATVMGPGGIWVEVQLRTERMDEIAERGYAAHWKYKQSDDLPTAQVEEFDGWLKKIREALNSPSESAVEFLDNIKMALYTAEIVVFTPKGEARKLPRGATALDFAYDIHSKIGNHAIGAKINHRTETVLTPLKGGDQVEIITADSAKPSIEWLEKVVTTKAVQSIKAYFKADQENSIGRGKELFEREMERLSTPPSGRVMRKVLPAYGCSNKDEFYSKIGSGIVTLESLEDVLRSSAKRKIMKFWELFLPKSSRGEEVSHELKVAECCLPIPGDSVVGIWSEDGSRVEVHKSSCELFNRLAAQHGERIVKEKIGWSQSRSESYLTILELRGVDRVGILFELSKVITCDFCVNIRSINIASQNGIVEGTVTLYVKSAESLLAVIAKLRNIKGIEVVRRLDSES